MSSKTSNSIISAFKRVEHLIKAEEAKTEKNIDLLTFLYTMRLKFKAKLAEMLPED